MIFDLGLVPIDLDLNPLGLPLLFRCGCVLNWQNGNAALVPRHQCRRHGTEAVREECVVHGHRWGRIGFAVTATLTRYYCERCGDQRLDDRSH